MYLERFITSYYRFCHLAIDDIIINGWYLCKKKEDFGEKKVPVTEGRSPSHYGRGKSLVQGDSPGTFIESGCIICMSLLLINRENTKKAKKMTFF